MNTVISDQMMKDAERMIKHFESISHQLGDFSNKFDDNIVSSALNAQNAFETTVAGTLQTFQKQFQTAWLDPINEICKKLETPFSKLHDFNLQYENSSFHLAVLEAQKYIETTAAGTLTQLHNNINSAWSEPLRQAHSILLKNKLHHDWQSEFEVISSRLYEFNELFKDIDFENVHINQDGSISLDNDSVSLEAINESISEIIEKGGDNLTLSSFFDEITLLAESFKKPVKAVFLYIILPYLIGIFATLTSPYYSNLITPRIENNKQEQVRQIKKQTIKNFPFKNIAKFRFVKANILNVRAKPSRKSEIIDELLFGQVVQIVEKKRNWSYVEYLETETGEFFYGWAFTRYLERFKK